MSERSILLLLIDIQTSVSKILSYTGGYTLEKYVSDEKTKDAVERNFEIIGEASSRLPETYKQNHHEIEWRIIKDFRNVIIHDYFGINDKIIWETIQSRLPDFLQQMNVLVENEKK